MFLISPHELCQRFGSRISYLFTGPSITFIFVIYIFLIYYHVMTITGPSMISSKITECNIEKWSWGQHMVEKGL